jgi:hypothetical protein
MKSTENAVRQRVDIVSWLLMLETVMALQSLVLLLELGKAILVVTDFSVSGVRVRHYYLRKYYLFHLINFNLFIVINYKMQIKYKE